MRALLLAALLAGAGLAAAHFEQDEAQQSANVGGRFLFMQTLPSPVLVGKPATAVLQINGELDFRPVTDANVTLVLDGERIPARASMPGSYGAPLRFSEQGTFDATWEFPRADGTPGTWNVTINVYRDLGIQAVPAQAEADLYANRTATVGVMVLNTTTYAPDPRVEDVVMRFERWSDAHDVLQGATEHPATFRDGAWWVTTDIRGKGMLHIKLASRSLGMGFDDTPYIHQYVLPEDLAPGAEEDAPANEAPLAPAGAVAALVLVALARRRR